MKVIRIMRFETVILADMTPRKPRTGCDEPPIAWVSAGVVIGERGVAHTIKQMVMSPKSTGIRLLPVFLPSTRPIPSQR